MKGVKLPDFSKMSRRERLLSIGGVLVMTILLLDRAVLGPVWHQTHRIRSEIQELEHTITTHHSLYRR